MHDRITPRSYLSKKRKKEKKIAVTSFEVLKKKKTTA